MLFINLSGFMILENTIEKKGIMRPVFNNSSHNGCGIIHVRDLEETPTYCGGEKTA